MPSSASSFKFLLSLASSPPVWLNPALATAWLTPAHPFITFVGSVAAAAFRPDYPSVQPLVIALATS